MNGPTVQILDKRHHRRLEAVCDQDICFERGAYTRQWMAKSSVFVLQPLPTDLFWLPRDHHIRDFHRGECLHMAFSPISLNLIQARCNSSIPPNAGRDFTHRRG